MIKNMNDIAPPKHMKNSCELSAREGELTLNYDNFSVSNGIINPGDIMEKANHAWMHLLNGAHLAFASPLCEFPQIKIVFYGIITYTCSRHLIQFPGYHNRNH